MCVYVCLCVCVCVCMCVCTEKLLAQNDFLKKVSKKLTQTEMTWIYTRLQCVVAAENLTACEGYEYTRHADL